MDAQALFLCQAIPQPSPLTLELNPPSAGMFFGGEVGSAPAAEFFHAQRPSPALHGPTAWLRLLACSHLFKDCLDSVPSTEWDTSPAPRCWAEPCGGCWGTWRPQGGIPR